MAIREIITANCENGQLSKSKIARQWDDQGTLIQFAGYPEPETDEELIFRLIVWMRASEGAEPVELPPIELEADQWLISNYYTQLPQMLRFQLCITNEAGTYEKHSPIFSGIVDKSLSHNGEGADIDVIPLFDPYKKYVDELILDAGARVVDTELDETSTHLVENKAVASAVADVNGRLLRQENAFDEASATVYPENIYDMSKNISGCRLQANGGTYNTPDYFTSDYIDVSFVGDKTLYLSKNNGELEKFMFICWYDINKNIISYSSKVEGSKQNDANAKYMRFSATAADYELNTYINIGKRASTYTAYFKPYHSTFWDKVVIFGYSKAGSASPKFTFVSGAIKVYVDGYLIIYDRTFNKSIYISTYNSTPQEFEISKNNALVYDYINSTLSVVSLSDIASNVSLIPLLIVDTNGIVSAGQWTTYLFCQTSGRYYKEPSIPYSPRSVQKTANSYASDQSMCIMNDWLICWDANDSDGLVRILDKTTKELIKLMQQSFTHGSPLSYDQETDALIIGDGDGAGSYSAYIFNNATEYIKNHKVFNASDAVFFDGLSIGVIGECSGIFYTIDRIGAYNTLANYEIKRYALGINNGAYDGTYELLGTYKGNYRLGVGQDYKYKDGFIYSLFGFKDAVVYKIGLTSWNEFVIMESYNVPNAETLEAEGIVVENDKMTISARDYNNMANKYFIEMKR